MQCPPPGGGTVLEALQKFVRVGSAYKETLCAKLKLNDKRTAEEKAAVAAHAGGLYTLFKSLKTVCVPPPFFFLSFAQRGNKENVRASRHLTRPLALPCSPSPAPTAHASPPRRRYTARRSRRGTLSSWRACSSCSQRAAATCAAPPDPSPSSLSLFFFPAQKLSKCAHSRSPPFPFLPPPRRSPRKNIFKDFIPEDNGSVAQTVHLAFKALSDRVVDALRTPDELSVRSPPKIRLSCFVNIFFYFFSRLTFPPLPHCNSLPSYFRRDTQTLERKLYMDLLSTMQDILWVHTEASSTVLSDWGRLLPELLEAVLCEDMPAACRRELTTTIGALTNTRGKALPANIVKFTELLMTNDFNTTNSTVLENNRYNGMPSSLAAFSGVLDTCGDFATQCNAVQILHAAGQLGGLDPKLTAKGFGDVKHLFLNLVRDTEDADEDMLDKTNELVTEYNISRGSKARCVTYSSRHQTLPFVSTKLVCPLLVWNFLTPCAIPPTTYRQLATYPPMRAHPLSLCVILAPQRAVHQGPPHHRGRRPVQGTLGALQRRQRHQHLDDIRRRPGSQPRGFLLRRLHPLHLHALAHLHRVRRGRPAPRPQPPRPLRPGRRHVGCHGLLPAEISRRPGVSTG